MIIICAWQIVGKINFIHGPIRQQNNQNLMACASSLTTHFTFYVFCSSKIKNQNDFSCTFKWFIEKKGLQQEVLIIDVKLHLLNVGMYQLCQDKWWGTLSALFLSHLLMSSLPLNLFSHSCFQLLVLLRWTIHDCPASIATISKKAIKMLKWMYSR